jgi:hypothetical protein
MEEPEVATGQLFESGEDAAVVLDLADEALHQVTLSVQIHIVSVRLLAVRTGGYYRDRPTIYDGLEELL